MWGAGASAELSIHNTQSSVPPGLHARQANLPPWHHLFSWPHTLSWGALLGLGPSRMVAQPGHLPPSFSLSLLLAAARSALQTPPYQLQLNPPRTSLPSPDYQGAGRSNWSLFSCLSQEQQERGQIEVIGSNFILAEEIGERGSWWGLAYSPVMGERRASAPPAGSSGKKPRRM